MTRRRSALRTSTSKAQRSTAAQTSGRPYLRLRHTVSGTVPFAGAYITSYCPISIYIYVEDRRKEANAVPGIWPTRIDVPYPLCTFCVPGTLQSNKRKQERPNNGRGPKSKTVAAVIIASHWQYRYVRGTEARHNSRPIYERTPANGTVPATNIWERNGDNEILLSGLFQCPTIYDWYGAMAEIQHAETTATNEECAKPYNYGAQGAYSTDKMAGVCTRLSGSSSATKIDMRQYSTVWGTVYGAENLGWPCTRILLVCISLRKKRIEHHRPASKKRGSSERAPLPVESW